MLLHKTLKAVGCNVCNVDLLDSCYYQIDVFIMTIYEFGSKVFSAVCGGYIC